MQGHSTLNLVEFIEMAQENDKVPVKCKHCAYKWGYTLKDEQNPGDEHNRISCPSCGGKTPYNEARLVNNDS